MLWRLAVLAFDSPRLRPLVARRWYDMLAGKAKRSDWSFMNYGFDAAASRHPPLEPRDEADRVSIQLYDAAIGGVDLTGARVLEVGCGRGGGASYIARYRGAAQVVGADFAPLGIALCKRQHTGVANLDFVVGNAEKLDLPDASFDALVNVESSHCYGSIEKFVGEAIRVLRPGGHFLFVDFRKRAEMPALAAVLDSRKEWTRVAHEDITAGVVAALEVADAAKRKWIEAAIKPRLRKVAGEVAGLVGSEMHRGFRDRDYLYHRFAYRRN
jgi:ubiquinone/menaquinone biosynthesis C-methylase UbiE